MTELFIEYDNLQRNHFVWFVDISKNTIQGILYYVSGKKPAPRFN